MMLWEEGAFELKDPVERFIPAFADARVWAGGSQHQPATAPAREPVRMRHLLTHTSGLTYGFHYAHPVDGIYRDRGVRVGRAAEAWTSPAPPTAGRACRCCSSRAPSSTTRSPPTSSGRVGRGGLAASRSNAFFKERIFEPLGMADTAFGDGRRRPAGRALRARPRARRTALGQPRLRAPDVLLGRGRAGLAPRPTTTASRACCWAAASWTARACSGRVRCASWAATTCPAGPSSKAVARPTFAETQNDGMGFGLGFCGRARRRPTPRSPAADGELALGRPGASTAFWVDPKERHHRAVLHPADAVQHLPAALAAAPARLPGARGLRCTPSSSASRGSHPASAPS